MAAFDTSDIDRKVRLRAFQWLTEQVDLDGDVLPCRPLLEQGFVIGNHRIHLVSQQGIFKPKILPLPLTITTVFGGPYDDYFGADGFLKYRYRGLNPRHPDNVGLREVMVRQIPLIYFHGVVKGKYLTVWPVYIIRDDPDTLTFTVAADDMALVQNYHDAMPLESDHDIPRRAYITTTVRQRLHQRGFRERVLHAYREQCALCRLRHTELLDAAHIIPDSEDEGSPQVSNGLSLCKLHHAAFDRFLLGITPDYTVELREDILDEKDGPILRHGLQGLHKARILLPRRQIDQPSRELLAERYERFRKAG